MSRLLRHQSDTSRNPRETLSVISGGAPVPPLDVPIASPRPAPRSESPVGPAMEIDAVQVAVVDAGWRIVAANQAWIEGARRVGHGELLAVGRSFVRFCEWHLMSGVGTADVVLKGIEAIEAGQLDQFRLHYAAPESAGHLQIAAFEADGHRYATISWTDTAELFGLRRERLQLSANLMGAQARLMRAQEDERQRVARELHDGAAQHLTGLNLSLARLRQVSGDPAVMGVAAEMGELLDQFYRDLRGLTYVLHPPQLERSGLHAAVRSLCTGLARRSGIDVSLRIYGTDRMRGSTVEATAYRIIQEALTNIHKHAGAKQVRVRLSDRPEALLVIVEDDGVGLTGDAGAMGVGIPGMIARVSELGGRFVIRNRRHASGTVLGAMVPRHGAGQAFLSGGLEALQRGQFREAS